MEKEIKKEEYVPTAVDIWARYMEYLYNTAIRMRKLYRIRGGKNIDFEELQEINERVGKDLETIMG